MIGLAERLQTEWRMLARVLRLRPFDTSTADGRSRERYRRIALTTVSSLGVRGVGILTSLITVPLVLAVLGKERYGLLSAITSLVVWAGLFDFGIANGLVNLVARAHGRDDRAEAARSFSTALVLLLALAAILAGVLALTAGHVPWHSILAVRGAVDDDTVRWSVIGALGVFIAGLPLSLVPQIYAGFQKTYAANAFTMIGLLCGFAALLAALHHGASMPVLVVLFGIGSLIGSALALVYALGFSMPWLRFRFAAVSRSALRDLVGRSLPIFLFQIGALAVNESQAIILAHRTNLSIVADYSIVMRLYVLILGLIVMSTQSFVPSFREAQERGDHDWTRRSFQRFALLRVSLAAAGGATLVLLGNPLIRIWLRRSDIFFSPWVWISMAVLMVGAAWVGVHSELLTIMDRLWVQVALVFVNAAVTIALTWWLAPGLGVLGVLLATGAVTVVCFSWALPALTRSLLHRATDAPAQKAMPG